MGRRRQPTSIHKPSLAWAWPRSQEVSIAVMMPTVRIAVKACSRAAWFAGGGRGTDAVDWAAAPTEGGRHARRDAPGGLGSRSAGVAAARGPDGPFRSRCARRWVALPPVPDGSHPAEEREPWQTGKGIRTSG